MKTCKVYSVESDHFESQVPTPTQTRKANLMRGKEAR